MLIYACEGLKKQHCRCLQLEVFRLNHASPERIRWLWDTSGQCLKGLRITFSIHFVIFAKKVFNFFFCSKITKSLINCLTFKLKKSKKSQDYISKKSVSRSQNRFWKNFFWWLVGVFWDGNELFRVRETLRKPSGTIS